MTDNNEESGVSVEADGADDPLASLTWSGVTPLGHGRALGLLASGPMAILAGFALASAIVLGVDRSGDLIDDGALVLFCVSSAILLWGLHSTAEAEGIHASPDDYLEWYPELRDPSWAARDAIRSRQREEFAAYFFYRRRGLNMYHLGTSTALTALALFLFGRVDGSNPNLDLTEDSVSDLILATGGLVLIFAAFTILSYAPAVHDLGKFWRGSERRRGSRTVAEWRWDAAVLKGAGQLVAGSLGDEEKRDLLLRVEQIASDQIANPNS